MANVQEAIALAEKLQSEGYDLFRGQSRAWPVVSSFNRLPEDERELQKQRLARFAHWVDSTPGLERLGADIDQLLIVAQHYGLPTNYLDFTTRPSTAAFFACEPCDAPLGEACIICLNSSEFENFWRSVASFPPFDKHPPILHRASIADLWRLEAQSGVAMFMPYVGIESVFDFDRIFFPAPTENFGRFDRSHIYPTEKSQLERLLDQFFQIDRARSNARNIETTASLMLEVDLEDEGLLTPGVSRIPFPDDQSWTEADARSWLEGSLPPESFAASTSHDIHLAFDPTEALDVEQLYNAIYEGLRSQALPRNSLARLKVLGSRTAALEGSIQRLWDGMRRLPYSDAVVAKALCKLTALYHECDAETWIGARWRDENSVPVEFGVADGSYSRSFVSRESLRTMRRADLGEFLTDPYHDAVMKDPKTMIRLIRCPRKAFDFVRFAEIFGSEILPVQEFVRPALMARVYSPLRIQVFGLQ